MKTYAINWLIDWLIVLPRFDNKGYIRSEENPGTELPTCEVFVGLAEIR